MAPDTVAVFNSSAETIEMLSVALQQAGMVVAAAFTYDLGNGTVDIGRFMRDHDPSVVIYDVAAPYDANWLLFERLRAHPAMLHRPVVLTSTDAVRVQQLAKNDAAVIDVAAKPFDLELVVRTTREALGTPFRELGQATGNATTRRHR